MNLLRQGRSQCVVEEDMRPCDLASTIQRQDQVRIPAKDHQATRDRADDRAERHVSHHE